MKPAGLALSLCFLGMSIASAPLRAQGVPCVDSLTVPVFEFYGSSEELLRLAEIMGATRPRPRLIRRPSGTTHQRMCAAETPWRALDWGPGETGGQVYLRTRPGQLRLTNNSDYPVDRDNGLVWTGRGPSVDIVGGAEFRLGPLYGVLAPVAAYQQNLDFPTRRMRLPGYSRYLYPWHLDQFNQAHIDWPQRMGPDPFWSAGWGQSVLGVELLGLTAGVSSENLWWGPAEENSIILSNTANGFPHVFAGTRRPLHLGIGRLEAELVLGRLHESEYFDANPMNDTRFFSGLSVDFEPAFAPGFFLGIARIFYRTIPEDGVPSSWYFPFFEALFKEEITVEDTADQMAALYLRWVFNDGEVYAEWARNDHNFNFVELINEPDHSQAYALGFRKGITAGGGSWLVLRGEMIHLGRPITTIGGRVSPTYYVHDRTRQGYTQEGQMLGAWIGPGSDSQTLGLDLYTSKGILGLYGERIRHDADAYQKSWIHTARGGSWGYDVELVGGVRNTIFIGPTEFSLDLSYSYRRNRDFLGLENLDAPIETARIDHNVRLVTGLAIYPHLALP